MEKRVVWVTRALQCRTAAACTPDGTHFTPENGSSEMSPVSDLTDLDQAVD